MNEDLTYSLSEKYKVRASNYTPFLTSALDGVSVTPRLLFTPGKWPPVPIG
jgi:hypothetical protein